MKKVSLRAHLFLVTFIVFTVNNFCSGQKVEGTPLTKSNPTIQPKMYDQPTGEINKKSAERSKTGTGIWVVFSDREENKTYLDKNCTKPFSSINFMTPLIVADETDNEIRVVEYDPSNIPFVENGKKLTFKAPAEDKGWIKKSKLLLWQSTLMDDTTRYSIKAVAVKKIESSASGIKNVIKKGSILDVYDAPMQDKKYENDKDSKLFEYLFVLKEDKESKMVLLSRKFRTNASNSKQDVLGWVPEKQIHKWDNALCLRINFDQSAIDERKERKIDIKFFRKPEEAKSYKSGSNPESLPFFYNDPGKEEKDNPYYYGFPIIGNNKSESVIFKTGYVTNTVDVNGNKIFSANTQARYNELYEDAKKAKESVNIVFVLDGSQKSFFKNINAALNDNLLIGSNEMTRNKYKLGAIIYNDSKAEDEERIIKINLNANKDDFMNRLSKEAAKVPETSINRSSNASPLFEAIQKSCALFGNNKSTNIIILTGTTADVDKKLKNAALKELVAKQAKLYCYQLENKGGSLYDAFLSECRFLLKESAFQLDTKYFEEKLSKNGLQNARLDCKENECNLINCANSGAILFKDAGESFKPEEVKKKIERLIKDSEEKLNELLAAYEKNTVSGSKEMSAENIEQIKQLAILLQEAGIPKDDIDKLAEQENFQLFIEAYTTIEHKSLSNQLMTRTLFMQRKEFQRLTDAFDKIAEATTVSSQRDAIISAYKTIINSYKGEIDQKILDNYSLDDFMKLVTSLPKTNNPLFDITLKEMRDNKKTKDEEIQKIRNAFNNIKKGLDEVKKKDRYHYETDDETFYWVPENIFKIN